MTYAPPRLVLLSSGSNAQNQLSHSGQEDSHVFLPCTSASSLSSTTELNSSFPPSRTRSVLQLAFGANHTLCLLDREGKREVWGCGDVQGGQLGLQMVVEDGGEGGRGGRGGLRPLELPPFPKEVMDIVLGASESHYQPIKIAASWTTTFIAFSSLLADSSLSSASPSSSPSSFDPLLLPDLLLAMGTNDFAELANGRRGGEDRFRWHVFRDEQIEDLVAGPRHALLRLVSVGPQTGGAQRLLGWGAARHGQLSTPSSSLSPQRRGDIKQPPVLLVPSPLSLPPVTQLALGMHHTLLLLPRQLPSAPPTLVALGRPSNPATQLHPPALDASSPTILQLASTWSTSLALLSDCTILLSSTSPTSISLPEGASHPVLRAGSEHVLVLLDAEGGGKEVWGWGWNEHGNMGDGTVLDWKGRGGLGRVWPTKEEGRGNGERVVDCWAGNGTSWVLVERDCDG